MVVPWVFVEGSHTTFQGPCSGIKPYFGQGLGVWGDSGVVLQLKVDVKGLGFGAQVLRGHLFVGFSRLALRRPLAKGCLQTPIPQPWPRKRRMARANGRKQTSTGFAAQVVEFRVECSNPPFAELKPAPRR